MCYAKINSSNQKLYFLFKKLGNEGCVIRGENVRGSCKYFSQCPKARDDYNRGIYPTLCSSGGFVCCPLPVNILSNSGVRISEQSNFINILKVS